MTPYQQGRDAFNYAQGPLSNPFDPKSQDAKDWIQGYEDAYRDNERIIRDFL